MDAWNRDVSYQSPTAQLAMSQYMSKVYMWMTAGIALTATVSWWVSSDQQLLYALVSNKILFYGLIIVQFLMVIGLSAGINRLSTAAATGIFLAYAALNGATLSLIALIYTPGSITSAFVTTTVAFGGLSAFGYVTKRDLGPVGSFCTMGLFGLIGFSLLSLFFPSMMGGTAEKVYGLVGIVVFAGLTAYDTQQIKAMAAGDRDGKRGILGALKLYMDFINLFLFILRMQGKRR